MLLVASAAVTSHDEGNLAERVLEQIRSLQIHVEVVKSRTTGRYILGASDGRQKWRVEHESLYSAACELARMVGIDLEG